VNSKKHRENVARYTAAKQAGPSAVAAFEDQLGKTAAASAKATADGFEEHGKKNCENIRRVAAAKLAGPEAQAALEEELGEPAFASAKATSLRLGAISMARSSDMAHQLTLTVHATGKWVQININADDKIEVMYSHILHLFGQGQCTFGPIPDIEKKIGSGELKGKAANGAKVLQRQGTIVKTPTGTEWRCDKGRKGFPSFASFVKDWGIVVTQRYGPRTLPDMGG
jgi:hypothetical protein